MRFRPHGTNTGKGREEGNIKNQVGFLGAIEHNTTALGWCVEQPMSLQAGHFQLGVRSEEDEVILTGYTSFVHKTFYTYST